jgi:hypothetical protein
VLKLTKNDGIACAIMAGVVLLVVLERIFL